MRERRRVRMPIAQRDQRDDALRRAVNVDRVRPVVKVLRRAVVEKEVRAIERQAATDAMLKLVGPENAGDVLQRAQVVSRVEVVDPLLRICLALHP